MLLCAELRIVPELAGFKTMFLAGFYPADYSQTTFVLFPYLFYLNSPRESRKEHFFSIILFGR